MGCWGSSEPVGTGHDQFVCQWGQEAPIWYLPDQAFHSTATKAPGSPNRDGPGLTRPDRRAGVTLSLVVETAEPLKTEESDSRYYGQERELASHSPIRPVKGVRRGV
jgi:hypothetical protein